MFKVVVIGGVSIVLADALTVALTSHMGWDRPLLWAAAFNLIVSAVFLIMSAFNIYRIP